MSSSGFNSLLSGVSRPLDKVLKEIGVSDTSTRGLITGGFAGTTPVSSYFLADRGRRIGQAVEDQRDLAKQNEANRQQFNEDVFNLAQGLEGRIASNPNVNYDQLQFEGVDPRAGELNKLTALFRARQQEVYQQKFQPGVSQTRLSLVE